MWNCDWSSDVCSSDLTSFRDRSRASSVVASAYASPALSPTDSAVLSAILAPGPADVTTGRTACSPVSGGGLPGLSPTASAAIVLGSGFLSSMVISVRLRAPCEDETGLRPPDFPAQD